MTHCLCTLPPQRTPYTCLCLYAISNVPKCNSCSAPCVSYEPDCCETDAYLRVLHVLDVALGSCSPLLCCSPLYTELTALQTASAPTTCASALGADSDKCTGVTYDEHAIEQQTTLVFHIAQQAQQQTLPMFNQIALVPHALHQSMLQWVCTSLTNDTPSLVRTLYRTYQRVNTILKYNKLATDINRMDRNAIQYTLNRWKGNVLWQEKALQHAHASANDVNDHTLRDTHKQLHTLRANIVKLEETLQSTETHYKHLQTLKESFVDIQRLLETTLKDVCKTLCDQWTSVGCQNNAMAVCPVVSNHSTLRMPLQEVRTRLEAINAYIQHTAMERTWSTSGHIVSKTSPALDAHLVKLGKLHICVDSNREARACMASFLSSFFCDDGAVKGTYIESVWCNALKSHMAELRHRVALAEAVMGGC